MALNHKERLKMRILYTTNDKAENQNELPEFMQTFGDSVVVKTTKFDLNFIQDATIDFIVSDRTQFLIPKDIIEFLPRKIINLHPSFLPWGRGYHPNYWSVVKQFPHGVTLHFIDEGIDSGDIIAQTRVSYSQQDTFKDTYYRLRRLMVNLFKTCWLEMRLGMLPGIPQKTGEGNLFYKKDFDGEFAKLPNGWETRICDHRDN